MPCLFVLISHYFKLLRHRNKNKFKQIKAEAAKKIKSNEPRQNVLVLIKKPVVYDTEKPKHIHHNISFPIKSEWEPISKFQMVITV